MLAPWKESYRKSRECIKKQRHWEDLEGAGGEGGGRGDRDGEHM